MMLDLKFSGLGNLPTSRGWNRPAYRFSLWSYAMKILSRSGIALLSLVIITTSLCMPLKAQTAAPSGAAAVPAVKALTIDDVIKLSKAGLGDDVIIGKLKKSGQAFDLTPDQMIQLKKAGVSDKVVQVMLDPTKGDPAPPAPAVVPAAGKPAVDPNLPDEVGVYFKKQSDTTWNEVLPEVINWKTGGVMKGIASYGVVKGDINGHIQGKSSNNIASTITEFLIVVPEGVAITEYQLLHLHQNSDNREFRSTTGGVFHASGGATRDAMPFDSKKVAPHRYVVEIPATMKAGEYGFMPPGAVASQNAAGSTGKLYSFKIIE